MTNEQQRIAQLEQTNRQWEAWYKAQQMQPQTPQYQQPQTAKQKGKKAKAPVATKQTSSEARFFAFCFVLALFALGIIVKEWNKPAEKQSTKITAR